MVTEKYTKQSILLDFFILEEPIRLIIQKVDKGSSHSPLTPRIFLQLWRIMNPHSVKYHTKKWPQSLLCTSMNILLLPIKLIIEHLEKLQPNDLLSTTAEYQGWFGILMRLLLGLIMGHCSGQYAVHYMIGYMYSNI